MVFGGGQRIGNKLSFVDCLMSSIFRLFIFNFCFFVVNFNFHDTTCLEGSTTCMILNLFYHFDIHVIHYQFNNKS